MKKTLNNIIYNMAYQILNMIIPLITAPYISRIMGPDGVGVYSYSTSVANYFAIFMHLGIANYGSRTIAINMNKGKEKISKSFWEMYAFQLISSIAMLVVFCWLMIVFDIKYKMAFMAQIFYLLSVMLDVGWYFVGTSQFKITVTRSMIIKILQTFFIFTIVNDASDIIVYILIITVGTLVGNLALWPLVLKQICFVKVKIKNIKQHIKPNLVLFMPILASSVFVYMDKIMLQIMTDETSNVGWYEYAEKIVRIPLMLISAIGAVMMPKISALISEKGEKILEKYMYVSMRYIALLSSAMCCGIVAVAPELGIVYLGEKFRPCGSLMQALSCIILFSSFSSILRTQYLMPMCKDKSYAISIILGAGSNLSLNIIFIPMFGAMGAVIGTIGAEVVACMVHIWSVRKRLPLKLYFKEWFHFMSIGVVMLILVRSIGTFVESISVRLIVEVVLGIISYCIISLFVLIGKKDDLLLHFSRRKGCT